MENPQKAQNMPIFIEEGKIIYEDRNVVIVIKCQPKGNTFKAKDEIDLDDIKRYCLIRYGSYSNIGSKMGGYSKAWAFRLLNGQRPVKREKTLIKIATALEIKPDLLKNALNQSQETLKVEAKPFKQVSPASADGEKEVMS